MYDRTFFQTTLGRTAIACVAAMTCFVALSTQIEANPAAIHATAMNAQFIVMEVA